MGHNLGTDPSSLWVTQTGRKNYEDFYKERSQFELPVKCLSRQPGFVYTNQSQGSALFNCQHIPQHGFDPQQASP